MYKEAIFLREKVSYIIIYKTPAEAQDKYAGAFDLVINSLKFE
jgi:hypothetical protein